MMLWNSLTPQLQLALIAMLPITEVNLAIPLGLTIYALPWWEVFVMSVLGNIAAASAVYLGLHAWADTVIKRVPFLNTYVESYLNRARRIFTGKYELWGVAGLILFIAVPLPFAGAWTAAAIAYVFGFPKKKSLLAISLGVILAAITIVIATLGIEFILGWFL